MKNQIQDSNNYFTQLSPKRSNKISLQKQPYGTESPVFITGWFICYKQEQVDLPGHNGGE